MYNLSHCSNLPCLERIFKFIRSFGCSSWPCQIVIFSKPPNIIATNISCFTVVALFLISVGMLFWLSCLQPVLCMLSIPEELQHNQDSICLPLTGRMHHSMCDAVSRLGEHATEGKVFLLKIIIYIFV